MIYVASWYVTGPEKTGSYAFTVYVCIKFTVYIKQTTVEPCLSNSHLYVRTLDYPEWCPKFLKQIIPNCWAHDPSFGI